MAERMSGTAIDARVLVSAGVAAVVVAIAIAAFVGNPVVVLIVSYAVLFGMAIMLFGDDSFAKAFNIATIIYVAAIVFVCTFSPLPGSTVEGLPQTDRLNYYYIYYIGNGLAGAEENIEAGYLLLVSAARLIMPFEVFLALVAVGVLISLLFVLRAMGQERLSGILALTLLSYFSFWSGALNITRQFVAAGIGFTAITVFLWKIETATWRRTVVYLLLVLLAATVHSSAVIFGTFGVVYALRRRGNRLLAVIWAGNIFLFILNYFNASPLSIIPGLSDRLARYDSSQISDESLAQFQSAGVTTGNRIDWAITLAFPVMVYAAGLFLRRHDPAFRKTADLLLPFALLYTVLCVPFYLLSSLTFGDRIAFYAFLILPAFLLSTVTNLVSREICYLTLLLVAVACVSQMAGGLYGYTPTLWLTGTV